MIVAHQPGSEPVKIPESVPNPAYTPQQPSPAPKEPAKEPAKASEKVTAPDHSGAFYIKKEPRRMAGLLERYYLWASQKSLPGRRTCPHRIFRSSRCTHWFASLVASFTLPACSYRGVSSGVDSVRAGGAGKGTLMPAWADGAGTEGSFELFSRGGILFLNRIPAIIPGVAPSSFAAVLLVCRSSIACRTSATCCSEVSLRHRVVTTNFSFLAIYCLVFELGKLKRNKTYH